MGGAWRNWVIVNLSLMTLLVLEFDLYVFAPDLVKGQSENVIFLILAKSKTKQKALLTSDKLFDVVCLVCYLRGPHYSFASFKPTL